MHKRVIWKIGVVVCILMVILVALTVQAQTPTPNPDTLLQDCSRNLRPDRLIPTGPDAPSIKIIAPTTGTIVVSDETTLANVDFTVEVRNWDLPGHYTEQDAPHWHLWLNDSVWGMFYQTQALSGVPYGTWRMCASLGDANHNDIGMPDAILLTVKRRDAQSATVTVQPTVTPAATSSNPSQPLPVPIIIALGLIVLFMGFILGRRRSNKSPS